MKIVVHYERPRVAGSISKKDAVVLKNPKIQREQDKIAEKME